mmetsp:Transcript_3003/g.10225  ORF Transcript_3003/g.10225 Transcript_3003/m.10225 type:complete len:960 (-) Transcript_3003:25-2904(-)
MEVRVDDVEGLPAHTYISIRYGEQRRQAPFHKGEVLTFPSSGDAKSPAASKAYTVDVFRKVGSKQVSLAGITALGGFVASEGLVIPSLEIHGAPITANLTAKLTAKAALEPEESKRQVVARRAKEYMQKHDIQTVLHEMFAKLLERQPGDPLSFMVDFLEHQRDEVEEQEAAEARTFASEPGLGASLYPGFADGSSPSTQELPDLSRHHSLVVDALRADPSLYGQLRDERTALGVSLAECIKPGVDCPGHELVKVAGAYAGDGESFERFWPLLGPVVQALHADWKPCGEHPREDLPSKLSNSRIDPTGRCAVYATMEVRRNLRGFRLPTACSKAERREVERVIAGAASKGLRGTYLPLRSSESWSGKVGGMSAHQEQRLRGAGMLFSDPDSRMRLSAGLGRQWPDARGVMLCDAEGLFLWCNEEDHLRFFARQHTTVDLKKLWTSLHQSLDAVSKAAEAEGTGFVFSEKLGYVTACPSRLGASLRVVVSLKIPLLAAAADLAGLCRSFDLQVSQESGHAAHGDVWNVSSGDPLGLAEVDLINGVMEGCRTLVNLEQRLEKGEPIYDAMPGLGPDPAPGFPHERCPSHLPDLSGHHGTACRELARRAPALYAELRGRRTPGGVGLAPCIKPGVDDRGHPNVMSAGIVAGEAACYETFSDLFMPVVKVLHSFSPVFPQPRDTLGSKLSNTKIDQFGLHALSVCVDVRRNLRGRRFAPCCSRVERREVERVLAKVMSIEGVCSGRYFPLAYSGSHAPMAGGMEMSQQEQLCAAGLLFADPKAPAKLAAGLGREWPDARGAFVADAKDLVVWVNEEDHLRFRSTQDGSDLKSVFASVYSVLHQVKGLLEQEGCDGFARDELLGYLTVDPAHVGLALRCSVNLRLPCLGGRPQLTAVCKALNLNVAWRGGLWEVSSGSTLGVSEVDIANEVIEGCARLVQLEEAATRGESIDDKVRSLMAGIGS